MVEYELHPEVPVRVDVEKRDARFHGFLKFCGWAGLHVLLMTGYLTLVFAIGMNWLVALIIMVIAGFAGGWMMKLGNAWTIGMIAQIAVVMIARLGIYLFNLAS